MNKYAIRATGLSKRFGSTLKSALKYGITDCCRRIVGTPSPSNELRPGEFWALDDISFEVHPGECLGIMGVNGSGKSTLLRILNGTYPPDKGEVRMRGRVGALIAAGAGFSPMLTGRENIYVNGTLIGLAPSEIRRKMDEIIHFAELENFIDMPVRNYSSGMAVRLGFAISAVSKPDILLVDEVLAVGDLNFQKKCYEYIHKLKKNGCAIALVSHGIGAIWAVCDHGLFLHKSKQVGCGDIENICRLYDDQNSRDRQNSLKTQDYGHEKSSTGDAECTKIEFISINTGKPVSEVGFREPFYVQYHITIKHTLIDPIFRSSFDAQHYKFIVSMDSVEQGLSIKSITPGKYILKKYCTGQSFRPGTYSINTSILKRNVGVHVFYWLGAASLVIREPDDNLLFSNPHAIWHMDTPFELTQVE